MGDFRGRVNEFQYSSSFAAAKKNILHYSSANANNNVVRITDLKMSNVATGSRVVKFYVTSYSTYGQPLKFDIPASSMQDYRWEIPYKFNVLASTGDPRSFVGSASGAGVKLSISGYTE